MIQFNLKDIMATGVTGIAVSGGILNADNPTEEMHKYTQIMQE